MKLRLILPPFQLGLGAGFQWGLLQGPTLAWQQFVEGALG